MRDNRRARGRADGAGGASECLQNATCTVTGNSKCNCGLSHAWLLLIREPRRCGWGRDSHTEHKHALVDGMMHGRPALAVTRRPISPVVLAGSGSSKSSWEVGVFGPWSCGGRLMHHSKQPNNQTAFRLGKMRERSRRKAGKHE